MIMKIEKVKNYEQLSSMAADLIAKQIREKPDCILGLATGSSPVGAYAQLAKLNLDFSKVKTFNLDEYCGLSRDHEQSYYHFMMENLFKHVNISHDNVHFPTEEDCAGYDKAIAETGGIDLQLLGVGRNGHIGFNEPDEVFHNDTRVVELTKSTIDANARFFDKVEDVPKTAISMGIGTIMAAQKIVLVAGADKADIIAELEKPIVSPWNPVSILHYHPDCTIICVEK